MSMSKRLVAATKVAGTMVAEELVAAGAEGVGGAMAEAIFIGGLATARFAQTAIWGAPPDLAPEEDAGTLVPTIGGIVVPFGLSKCTADRDTSVTTWDISAEVFDLREHRLKLARPMLSTHDPLIALKMVDTLHVIDVSDSDPGAWKIDHQGDTSISDQVPSPRLIDIPMATM